MKRIWNIQQRPILEKMIYASPSWGQQIWEDLLVLQKEPSAEIHAWTDLNVKLFQSISVGRRTDNLETNYHKLLPVGDES